MNKDILHKNLDIYFSKLSQKSDINDLNERIERELFYKNYTYDKIISMNENEFYEYISKLWAMIIWG